MPQYMLGDDLVVSPITHAADNVTNLATQTVWVPPGAWLDRASGVLRVGGTSTGGASTPKGAVDARVTRRAGIAGIAADADSGSGTCPTESVLGVAVDCAPGFDKLGCLAKGCCWAEGDNLQDGAPQCFFTMDMSDGFFVRIADLDETPLLVRAGSIVPELEIASGGEEVIGVALKQYEQVRTASRGGLGCLTGGLG